MRRGFQRGKTCFSLAFIGFYRLFVAATQKRPAKNTGTLASIGFYRHFALSGTAAKIFRPAERRLTTVSIPGYLYLPKKNVVQN
ncbi:MAG: hypothetical protein O3B08_02935 [Proteobacteria bacterium]|nr:hypothetical protein [Pseudomonadota bacterium]